MLDEPGAAFTEFVAEVEPRVRRALVALCGPDLAPDAAAEGFAYAWSHWDRVAAMDNPAGYVYRVACRWAARQRWRRDRIRRREMWLTDGVAGRIPEIEPALARAVAALPARQRVSVLLVHGYGWTHREVAELLGVSVSTSQSHASRGMAALRRRLEVSGDGGSRDQAP